MYAQASESIRTDKISENPMRFKTLVGRYKIRRKNTLVLPQPRYPSKEKLCVYRFLKIAA